MARQIINLPFRTLKGSVTTPTGPDDAASDGVAGHTAGNTFNSDPDNPNTGTFYLQTPSARGDGAIQLDFGAGGVVFEADFLVFTYNFTAEDGRDLDTRTSITYPISRGPLGWCKDNEAPPLYYGGDNTGIGVESCYVDLTDAAFDDADYVSVLCQCWWYKTRAAGDVSLDIVAYLGGSMSQVGYAFVNVGGEQTADISCTSNVLLNESDCVATPETLGTVTYNFNTNALTIDGVEDLWEPWDGPLVCQNNNWILANATPPTAPEQQCPSLPYGQFTSIDGSLRFSYTYTGAGSTYFEWIPLKWEDYVANPIPLATECRFKIAVSCTDPGTNSGRIDIVVFDADWNLGFERIYSDDGTVEHVMDISGLGSITLIQVQAAIKKGETVSFDFNYIDFV